MSPYLVFFAVAFDWLELVRDTLEGEGLVCGPLAGTLLRGLRRVDVKLRNVLTTVELRALGVVITMHLKIQHDFLLGAKLRLSRPHYIRVCTNLVEIVSTHPHLGPDLPIIETHSNHLISR